MRRCVVCIFAVCALAQTDPLAEANQAYKRNDYERVRTLLAAQAKEGNAKAQVLLGRACQELGETKTAFSWYVAAAAAGDLNGKYRAGVCYLDGVGVTKNPTKGVALLRTVAKTGHDEAQHRLGHYLIVTPRFKKYREEGIKWLTDVAKRGHWGARYTVYWLSSKVEIYIVDFEVYQGWLVQLARRGHASAQYYYSGRFILKTDERIKWLRRAALQGHAAAQLKLGEVLQLEYKRGTESRKWLVAAAKQGLPQAAEELYLWAIQRAPWPEGQAWTIVRAKMHGEIGQKKLAAGARYTIRYRRGSHKIGTKPRQHAKDVKEARKLAKDYWELVKAGVKARKADKRSPFTPR